MMIRQTPADHEGGDRPQYKFSNVTSKDYMRENFNKKVITEEDESNDVTEVMSQRKYDEDQDEFLDIKPPPPKVTKKHTEDKHQKKVEPEFLLKQKDEKIKDLEEKIQKLTSENWRLSKELEQARSSTQLSKSNQGSLQNLALSHKSSSQTQGDQPLKQNSLHFIDNLYLNKNNIGKLSFYEQRGERSPNLLNSKDQHSYKDSQQEDDIWQMEDQVSSLLSMELFNQSLVHPQKKRLKPIIKPQIPQIQNVDPQMNIKILQSSLNRDLFRAAEVKRTAFIKENDDSTKLYITPRTKSSEKNTARLSSKRSSSKSQFEPAQFLRPYPQTLQVKDKMVNESNKLNTDYISEKRSRDSNQAKATSLFHSRKDLNSMFFDKPDYGHVKHD